VAEPSPDLQRDLQGLQDALHKADDPQGLWRELLGRCQAEQLRYPEAGDTLAYLARAIADATPGRLADAMTLRDQLHKATGSPKSWADAQARERENELLQQQLAAEAEQAADRPEPTTAEREAAAPYRVLGWDRDRRRIWYQHRETAQISWISPGPSFDRLLPLAPLRYWEEAYPSGNRNGGADWLRAVSDLASAADRAGVFDPQRIRGRGVWLDAGRTVWHLGDRLEVDGIETPLAVLLSVNHYPRLPALQIDTKAAPLSDQHGQQILDLIRRMGWSGPSDHLQLAGWIVLSNVGGALHKRPGLQLTSGFGSGKSDTADSLIWPLQAGLGISCSGSTEAGVRQSIRHDARPVLIDESEQADGNRREQQLRLVRLSYDGKPMVKGTPGGEALEFTLRVPIALAGINAPISNPADLSRIAVIGRRQLPGEQWQQIAAERTQLVTHGAGEALIRRTVSNLPTLLANIATMGRVLAGMAAGRGGGRVGDTYGALLAGCHLLTSTALLNEAEALAWLDTVGWDPAAPAADEVDRSATAEARQCLDHLLSHELPWRDPEASDPSTGRITVLELLSDALAHPHSEAPNALGRRGLKADPERGLLVANSGAAIEKVFAGSKWSQGGHRARLLELEGAALAGPQRFPVLGPIRCAVVPWQLLEVDPALVEATAKVAAAKAAQLRERRTEAA
jgi:putative DNA primase/helicase